MRTSATSLSLKDILRETRFFAYRVRSFARGQSNIFGSTVGRFARMSIRGFDSLASRVNESASTMSHQYLDAPIILPDGPVRLDEILKSESPAVAFAQETYRPLGLALEYFGAEAAFLSESKAAEAYRASVESQGPDSDRLDMAVALFGEMLRLRVIRRVLASNAQTTELSDDEFQPIVLFALMLWLLAEDQPGLSSAEKETIVACCDLAMALKDELIAKYRDQAELKSLVSTFAERL